LTIKREVHNIVDLLQLSVSGGIVNITGQFVVKQYVLAAEVFTSGKRQRTYVGTSAGSPGEVRLSVLSDNILQHLSFILDDERLLFNDVPVVIHIVGYMDHRIFIVDFGFLFDEFKVYFGTDNVGVCHVALVIGSAVSQVLVVKRL